MIRRQLRPLLPAFAHWYGIKPWQVERLTFAEIEELVHQLPEPQE